MIKSYCVLEGILYYSSGDIVSLLDLLNTGIDNDMGRIEFIGNIVNGVKFGTYHINGNFGARKALPYLEKYLVTDYTKYIFHEYDNTEYNINIKNIERILIGDISYDKTDIFSEEGKI